MARRVDQSGPESVKEKQQRQRAEHRAELERELSDDAIERLGIMDKLRESGKLSEMIEIGNFSDMPELRPDHDE